MLPGLGHLRLQEGGQHWLQLPDLTSAPPTGTELSVPQSQLLRLSQEVFLRGNSTLRDGALCPGDSNMGMGPRSHTRSPPHQPRVLHGVHTGTAVACEALLRDLSCSPVPPRSLPLEADPGEAVRQEGGGGTLGCSPQGVVKGKEKAKRGKGTRISLRIEGASSTSGCLRRAPSSHQSHSW